jgi:hypothetical protein
MTSRSPARTPGYMRGLRCEAGRGPGTAGAAGVSTGERSDGEARAGGGVSTLDGLASRSDGAHAAVEHLLLSIMEPRAVAV